MSQALPTVEASVAKGGRRGPERPPEPKPGGGTLYVVGTPIGNLGDITLRAIETLRSVDIVAAEDTRRARALLSHLGITGKRLFRVDAHADSRALAKVVSALGSGKSAALVTDAGMPGVSDPGAALVRVAIERDIAVTVVPGPCAATATVALSGLVGSAFYFAGFLPRRGRARAAAIARVAATLDPVVLFEAPTRTRKTLRDLASRAADRQAAVAREITKVHEEVVRGTLALLAATERDWRGEIAIVLGEATSSREESASDEALDDRIRGALSRGDTPRDVSREVAAWSGRPRRNVYARAVELSQLARRDRG